MSSGGEPGALGEPGTPSVNFAVFTGQTATELATKLNGWATTLPSGARVRRTQLCSHEGHVVALVNWDVPKGGA